MDKYTYNALSQRIQKLEEIIKNGGKGSGNFGHAGRPGERGGSAPTGTNPSSTGAKVNPKLVAQSMMLRDYIDNVEYADDEHHKLADIADSLYNAEIGPEHFKPDYKELYDKYGKEFFDEVMEEAYSIDKATDTTEQEAKLLEDYKKGLKGSEQSSEATAEAKMETKPLSQFMQLAKTTPLEMKQTSFHGGEPRNPNWRSVEKVQTRALRLGDSYLDLPKASLVEVKWDDKSGTGKMKCYEAGFRDYNKEEKAALAEWKEISSTPEFQQRAEVDALTDGSSTYYQQKGFWEDKGMPYMFHEKQGGKERRQNPDKKDKDGHYVYEIQDDSIKGKLWGEYDIRRKGENNSFNDKVLNGGKGSGNFGHSGRPGEVGGSAPSGYGSAKQERRMKKTSSETRKDEKVFDTDEMRQKLADAAAEADRKRGMSISLQTQLERLAKAPYHEGRAEITLDGQKYTLDDRSTAQALLEYPEATQYPAFQGLIWKLMKTKKNQLDRKTFNAIKARVDQLEKMINGGAGSGNFGHAGRPGEVGGSAPTGSSSSKPSKIEKSLTALKKLQSEAKEIRDSIEDRIGQKMADDETYSVFDVASKTKMKPFHGEDGTEYLYDKENDIVSQLDDETGDLIPPQKDKKYRFSDVERSDIVAQYDSRWIYKQESFAQKATHVPHGIDYEKIRGGVRFDTRHDKDNIERLITVADVAQELKPTNGQELVDRASGHKVVATVAEAANRMYGIARDIASAAQYIGSLGNAGEAKEMKEAYRENANRAISTSEKAIKRLTKKLETESKGATGGPLSSANTMLSYLQTAQQAIDDLHKAFSRVSDNNPVRSVVFKTKPTEDNAFILTPEQLDKTLNGGRGSGNFGHAGRPGEVGGSAPEGVESFSDEDKLKYYKARLADEEKAKARAIERGMSEAKADKMFGKVIDSLKEDIAKTEGKSKKPAEKKSGGKSKAIDDLADEVYSYIGAQRTAMKAGYEDAAGAIGTKMGFKHVELAKKLLGGDLKNKEKAVKVYKELQKDLKKAKGNEKGRIEAKMYALADMVGELGYDIQDKYIFFE